jgi:hypothetical protein
MTRSVLCEAANALMTRVQRWSWLKNWGVEIARRRGQMRARIAKLHAARFVCCQRGLGSLQDQPAFLLSYRGISLSRMKLCAVAQSESPGFACMMMQNQNRAHTLLDRMLPMSWAGFG